MSAASHRPKNRKSAGRSGAGNAADVRSPAGWRRAKPTPGWKGLATTFVNTRVPSLPTTLELSLEEYFSAGALVGLLASQDDEPDHQWACAWSTEMGRVMAAAAIKRRRGKR